MKGRGEFPSKKKRERGEFLRVEMELLKAGGSQNILTFVGHLSIETPLISSAFPSVFQVKLSTHGSLIGYRLR